MIKVIIDTNVFISGIFWSGPPFKILSAWRHQKLKLIYSADILEEYIRVGHVLSKKYKGVEISSFIDLITIFGELHTPIVLDAAITDDPDDDKFIACALSASCKYIISGDKHLLDVDGFSGIHVLKPAAFVKMHLS